MLRLRSTFLRICSGTPSTQPGLLWSNYFSKYTHISTALSNNAGQKSCRLKLSLLSTSTNIRGLKQWVIMNGDWWKGPLICSGTGWKSCMVLRKQRGKAKGAAGMYACVCVSFGGTLGSAAVLTNPSKTSTHFLCRHSRCLADLAPLSSFVCVFCSQSKQVMAS